VIYESDTTGKRIYFIQYLPQNKIHYSTEGSEGKKVSFGKYFGEYIETIKGTYLIVSDGTYMFSLMADSINEKEMIKILESS
jgi:hypothetical protein